MSAPSAEEMRSDVLSLFSPSRTPRSPGAVGIELEVIPLARTANGAPRALPILPVAPDAESLSGFLSDHAEATERLAADWDQRGTPRYRTWREGFVRFEPGGQIEYATEARLTAAEAISDMEAVMGDLVDAADKAGVELLSCGLNPFLDADQVELHLKTPRYLAMDAHFNRVGPYGRRMMRLTASMQVNLDFGDPTQAHLRWSASNLLAPVCTAVFANSPVASGPAVHVSGRALAWELADPTRTGVAWSPGDAIRKAPWTAYTVFALTADAMLRLDPGGAVVTAPSGVRFNEWWSGVHGSPPSVAEWRMHLTSLFPEVRPRGWLELRSIDTPGREWWAVPPTLLAALLYDDLALGEILDALESLGERMPELFRAAARVGLRDPDLGAAAEAAFDIALKAASRFPPGYFDAGSVSACERFAERYVAGRRMQADDRAPGVWGG